MDARPRLSSTHRPPATPSSRSSSFRSILKGSDVIPISELLPFFGIGARLLNASSNASSVAKWRRQRPERLRSSKCANRLRESARHFTAIVGQSVDMLQDTRSDRYPIARRLNTVPRCGGPRGLRPRRGRPRRSPQASQAIGATNLKRSQRRDYARHSIKSCPDGQA